MSKIPILAYIIITALALIAIKLGSKNGAPIYFLEGKMQLNITLFSVAGIILYGLSFLLYMYLISKYDLGYIIPLTTAVVYVLIFIASFFIFNEIFTLIKIVGIILILTGVILLNLKQ